MDLIGYAVREEQHPVETDGAGNQYIQVSKHLRVTASVDDDGHPVVRLATVSGSGKVFRGPHVRREHLLETIAAMVRLLV